MVKAAKSTGAFAATLAGLGFASYADYLNSPLWAGIRSRVYAVKGRKCTTCNKAKGKQIHHERYDSGTMAGRTIEHLRPICGACHQRTHGISPKPSKKAKAKKRSRARRPRGEWGKCDRQHPLWNLTRLEQAISRGLNIRAYGASRAVVNAFESGHEWRTIVYNEMEARADKLRRPEAAEIVREARREYQASGMIVADASASQNSPTSQGRQAHTAPTRRNPVTVATNGQQAHGADIPASAVLVGVPIHSNGSSGKVCASTVSAQKKAQKRRGRTARHLARIKRAGCNPRAFGYKGG